MNVLLVAYDNDSYIHWFPQGLAYIAAVLQKEGYEVQIYNQDQHHYPDEHLTAYLDKNHFDVVGIGVVAGYYQYRKLLKLSDAINKSSDRPYYIIGGHGPSPEPEYFLKKTQADAAVLGEGEDTIVELLQAIGNRSALSRVKGIAYRSGKTVTVNPRRPLITDVDAIPFPAFDLFPMEYYRLLQIPYVAKTNFVFRVLSGRGCKFTCNFCYRMDKGFRPRSNESIIEEVKLLMRNHGITYIMFTDELLMSSEERTISLCESFLKAKLKIKWDCNGRLNYAKPDVLKIMKRSGCVFINYGIEAMDDQILKNMKKALTTDMIIKGVEATLKAGIHPGLNILFGNLGENKATLDKAVEFLLRYDDGAQLRTIRPVTPYPGSPLYYHAIEHGLLKDVEEFYEKKHLNSDLLAVNFTELSDDEFHHSLYEANTKLIKNFYARKTAMAIEDAANLYLKRDANFRGFRQL